MRPTLKDLFPCRSATTRVAVANSCAVSPKSRRKIRSVFGCVKIAVMRPPTSVVVKPAVSS